MPVPSTCSVWVGRGRLPKPLLVEAMLALLSSSDAPLFSGCRSSSSPLPGNIKLFDLGLNEETFLRILGLHEETFLTRTNIDYCCAHRIYVSVKRSYRSSAVISNDIKV